MERTDILELMSTLKLYGMRAAYDEVMTTGIKRRHEPPRIVGDLLSAEIAEKQARSIKYQLTLAKLPLAKDIDDFDFTGTPINEALIRDLASGSPEAGRRQPGMQPLRQRTSLQANPSEYQTAIAKERDQRLRLARDLLLADDLSGRVHHAHAAQFQRHVDCGKILHGCPSSMLGADPFGPRS